MNLRKRGGYSAWFRMLVFWVAAAACCPHVFASGFLHSRVQAIELEISQLEAELEGLPQVAITQVPWTLGYSSRWENAPDRPVTIDIRFAQPAEIDTVVLMPATFSDESNTLRSFGFPERFFIEFIRPDGSTDMIADHREASYPAPGTEPQVFDCEDAFQAVGIRIHVTRLAPNVTWWNARYLMALSEVFVFSGPQNVALNADVKASSDWTFPYVWTPSCLVDGFSLYSSLNHHLGHPYHSFEFLDDDGIVLNYDLGEACEVDELRLWPVAHSVQMNFPPSSGIGFPTKILVEGSLHPDFSDATVVYQSPEPFFKPGSNPLMCRLNPGKYRYLRFTLRDGVYDFRVGRKTIALSELEIFGRGKLVSGGKMAEVSIADGSGLSTSALQRAKTHAERLTDGQTNEGDIIDLRQWVTQFKRRVELEHRLGELRTELGHANQQERERLGLSIAIAIILIVLLFFLVWLVRVRTERRASLMREEIADGLHDEIGANLSSIANSAELVRETMSAPLPNQAKLLDNVIRTARVTAEESRQLVRFIENKETTDSLLDHFREEAERMLPGIRYTCSFSGERAFNRLGSVSKWHLLLFYKEVLNNIIKHARADYVEITTHAEAEHLELLIKDNGRGIPAEGVTLKHLNSRAKKLRADLSIDSKPDQETIVSIRLGRMDK